MDISAKNGFDSWVRTHHEIVAVLHSYLAHHCHELTGRIAAKKEASGYYGMHDLAVELTNQFELKNQNRKWNGEFLNEVFQFAKTELEI